jgi:hypothetical protein
MADNTAAFDFTDTMGKEWTFYPPSGSSTVWTGALKQDAYGQPAGKKIIAADTSDALTLQANEVATSAPGGPQRGQLSVPVTPDAPAAKGSGAFLWLLILGAFYLVDKRTKRRA